MGAWRMGAFGGLTRANVRAVTARRDSPAHSGCTCPGSHKGCACLPPYPPGPDHTCMARVVPQAQDPPPWAAPPHDRTSPRRGTARTGSRRPRRWAAAPVAGARVRVCACVCAWACVHSTWSCTLRRVWQPVRASPPWSAAGPTCRSSTVMVCCCSCCGWCCWKWGGPRESMMGAARAVSADSTPRAPPPHRLWGWPFGASPCLGGPPVCALILSFSRSSDLIFQRTVLWNEDIRLQTKQYPQARTAPYLSSSAPSSMINVQQHSLVLYTVQPTSSGRRRSEQGGALQGLVREQRGKPCGRGEEGRG